MKGEKFIPSRINFTEVAATNAGAIAVSDDNFVTSNQEAFRIARVGSRVILSPANDLAAKVGELSFSGVGVGGVVVEDDDDVEAVENIIQWAKDLAELAGKAKDLWDNVLVKMMVEAGRPHSAAVPRENRREGADILFQHQLDQYIFRLLPVSKSNNEM